MNYKLRFFIILLNIFIPYRSCAFIYEVKILRKWDAARNSYHYFIGLSDFHDKTHSSNKDHLALIESVLRKTQPGDVKIILEDLSSVNSTGQQACGRFIVNSRGGVLGGLATTTKKLGHEVDNVEFRYCRVTALGPVLNNLKENCEKFPSVASTYMHILHNEILDVIKEINTYNDGSILKNIYQTQINDVQKMLKLLHIDQHLNDSVARYLTSHSDEKNRLNLLKRLLTFDSSLLDMRLVHSVLQAPGKAKVIAIAGGAHISKATELLEKMGYQSVKNTKVTFAKEHDLQRCLGSHIVEGAFCVKPEPIKLDFLENLVLGK